MFEREKLREGMIVRSADGDKLGKIVQCDDAGIQIEKGIFFPKEYLAHYDQVSDISGDDVYLKWGTDLVEQRYDNYYGAGSYRNETADESMWNDYRRPDLATSDEQRIPLKEEELRAERKGMRETGRVRIMKTVHTEDKTFTVPVSREEVHIERVPASEASLDRATEGEFKDETVTIPVREEEVEVTKRPTVREEIRVSKTTEQAGEEVSGTVRREEAEIEREGGSKKDKFKKTG